MSKLSAVDSHLIKVREELDYFLRWLETERFQKKGWQELYHERLSLAVLIGRGSEIPPCHSSNSVFQCKN